MSTIDALLLEIGLRKGTKVLRQCDSGLEESAHLSELEVHSSTEFEEGDIVDLMQDS